MNYRQEDIISKDYTGKTDFIITNPPKEMNNYLITAHELRDIYGKMCPHCGSDNVHSGIPFTSIKKNGFLFWRKKKKMVRIGFWCAQCHMTWETPWKEYEEYNDKENR